MDDTLPDDDPDSSQDSTHLNSFQTGMDDVLQSNDVDSMQSLDFHPAEDRGWSWMDPWAGRRASDAAPESLDTPQQLPLHSADASVMAEESLTEEEKRGILQSAFIRAASHGDVERMESMLKGATREYIDIDGCDETGGTAIIFAACFGHQGVVEALLEAGANINVQDKAKWTPLMWAVNNHHKGIVKLLLAHGASFHMSTEPGKTALDMSSQMDMIDALQAMHVEVPLEEHAAAADQEWYSQDRTEHLEEQMTEALQRHTDAPTSLDFEVGLSTLAFEKHPTDVDNGSEILLSNQFTWNKCLPEQMYVFSEDHIPFILNLVVTDFEPSRSVEQKLVPADIIFLCLRFAHYYGTKDMFRKLLHDTLESIRKLIRDKSNDMAILAFWISNTMLLLYYIKKDPGLLVTIIDFQLQLTEIIHEIYLSFIQESKNRIEKHLDDSILNYASISNFENITFESQWHIFRRQRKKDTFIPHFSKKHATPSPLLITILLSSIFFVLDVYNVHPIIFKQAISQIFYWLSAELFNRIIMKKSFLSRSKAMDIRLNISIIEDWARANSYQFQNRIDIKSSSLDSKSFNMYDCLKNHMAPLIQLLQWLQCITSLNNIENIKVTVGMLNLLTSTQLLYTAKNYRLEVNENKIGKETIQYLSKKVVEDRNIQEESIKQSKNESVNNKSNIELSFDKEKLESSKLLMNATLMLSYIFPTGTDILANYDSKVETNKKKEKCFVPTIPSYFVDMLKIKTSYSNENQQKEAVDDIKPNSEVLEKELAEDDKKELAEDDKFPETSKT